MKLSSFPLYDIHLSGVKGPGASNDSDRSYNELDDDHRQLSYCKYGGYNGWDDDTIDSAFDGIPEATWNVD